PQYRSADVDMAQALFGRVRDGRKDERTDQIRGRVFFEDIRCDKTIDQVQMQPPTRYVLLSGPKPTALQVYLADQRPGELKSWDHKDANVAGQKLYWHRWAQAAKQQLHTVSEDAGGASQVTRLRPIREGTTFTGRVRFENLTAAELGALYAAIQLPQGLAHKF